jgi:GT2 family glycosyltransferase
MDLSIVIVNWNTQDLLVKCLSSISDDLSAAPGLTAETIVVDNASHDDSVSTVRRQFPWVRLVPNETNVGFARANNQAIQLSQGRYILLLNSDTELCQGALSILVAFMESHSIAGAAGAQLLNGNGSRQISCHPLLTPWREFWRLIFIDWLWPRATYNMRRWSLKTPHEVEVIKGACLMLRREALGQVGLLDEQYFMYTEEMDLCYRLRQAGWKLYWVPEAQVIHYGEQSSRQMAEDMYIQLYRSKVQFQRKFGGEGRARLFKRLITLAYLPRAVAASSGAILLPALAPRARTFRRLLREVGTM